MAIRERIGYPDEIVTDDNKLNSEYEEVSLHKRQENYKRVFREGNVHLLPCPSECTEQGKGGAVTSQAGGAEPAQDVTADVTGSGGIPRTRPRSEGIM